RSTPRAAWSSPPARWMTICCRATDPALPLFHSIIMSRTFGCGFFLGDFLKTSVVFCRNVAV
ncbi:hypothetical protein, partial [Pseudomonas aeruginosa]